MINESDLTIVGKINKTHGVDGEMSVSFVNDEAIDVIDLDTCLLMKIDGIFVPFFVDGVRPRGNDSLLISFEGEDTQEAASAFVGLDVYMRKADLPVADDADDTDGGFYAAQLIGFKALADDTVLGEIIDIDDSTDNPLFIINREGDKTLYIPIVDEFIDDISIDNKLISFDLPDGLLDL